MRRAIRRFTQWLTRLLLHIGLLPASTKADTDTMGEYKRLMAEKDDPKPGLVLPDPNAPHADLIRRVRLYAQNGAKALAPLLDEQWGDDEFRSHHARACTLSGGEDDVLSILGAAVSADTWRALHAAYNATWTVIDGEVYEYENERKRSVVQ